MHVCRGYADRIHSCLPPFGADPNCYSIPDGLFFIAQEVCVSTTAAVFNISTPEILQQLYETNVRADETCAAFTTMVRLAADPIRCWEP
jgi:hypothetical protein